MPFSELNLSGMNAFRSLDKSADQYFAGTANRWWCDYQSTEPRVLPRIHSQSGLDKRKRLEATNGAGYRRWRLEVV